MSSSTFWASSSTSSVLVSPEPLTSRLQWIQFGTSMGTAGGGRVRRCGLVVSDS